MIRVSFSDWQEMALKKDIEDIKKKINSQEPILFSVCWEIVLALGTVIVDHLFDVQKAPIYVWIIVMVAAVLPPIVVLIDKLIKWIRSIYLVRIGNLKIRSYIDLFDNQISYWVMLSNSYADMLTEAINDGHSTAAEKEFLYREGCYYNNKSMQALYSMKPNFSKIFSDNIDIVKKRNLIDLARLHNLLKVMNEQQIQLDRDIIGTMSRGVELQKDINKKYLEELQDFLVDLNFVYESTKFEWDVNFHE